MHEAWIALAVGAAYLLGSVDFGVIVSRMRGVDIYGAGSGNPGATNVLRSMGRKAAALVMVGDLAKGVAAAGGMILLLQPTLGAILVAVWVTGVALTHKASVSSLVVAVALVPGLVAFGERGWPLLWSGVACLLIVVRHSGNIRRLLAGSELDIEEAAH